MFRRSLTVLLIVGATLTISIPAMADPVPSPGSTRHPSGLTIIAASNAPRPSVPEASNLLLHDATMMAGKNPDDFGYSWYDARTGEVVINTTTAKGEQIGRAMPNERSLPATPRRFNRVSYSFRTLERIKHDAIGLPSTVVPDSAAIYETGRDRASNRVLITVQRLSDGMLNALAARYGTTAIAIEYRPDRPRSAPASRTNNASPLYGGAEIGTPNGGTCTSGFPWLVGSTNALLTAGHCAPVGGNISTTETVGSVAEHAEENWDTGVGSVLVPGQLDYNGDLAVVRLNSLQRSMPDMFRGGPTSSQTASVMEWWSRRGESGDLFCTGGKTTGEQCGWRLDLCGDDHQYDNGEIARNICVGVSTSNQIIPGDSGGPVYTVRPDGGIAAKGIISGYSNDPIFHRVIYTDIWDSFNGLPGLPNTTATNPQPRNATPVAQSNGVVDVFWKGTDRGLWHKGFDGHSWNGLDPVATPPLGSNPIAVTPSLGVVDVFWRGTDDALWHKWLSYGTWYGPEQLSLTGVVGGPLTAVTQSNGIIDVFWKGTNGGALMHKWYSYGTWYGPETLNTGTLGSDPVVVSPSLGIVDVFWRGTDGGLWQKWFSYGTWYGPQNLGGTGQMAGTPSVVAQPNGIVDVFSRGTNGDLWHKWFAYGTWYGPQRMNVGPVGSDPAAVTSSAGVVHVFWKGQDLNLWYAWFNGTSWAGPLSLGSGPVVEPPAAVGQSNGIVDVFFKGADDALWHKWLSYGTWYGPERLGGSIT
jgi:Trypsin